MKVIFSLFFCLLGILPGCVTPQSNYANISNIEISEISKRDPAPVYPFEEFYKTTGITNYLYSSNGQEIFFLKSDGKTRQIFLYNLLTKKTSQITKLDEPVKSFILDKQGRNVFFQQDKGGSELFDIYRLDLNSKKITAITNGKNKERSFLCDISAEGNNLYFVQSKGNRSENDIKRFSTRTGKTQIILEGKGRQLYCETLNKAQDHLIVYDFVDNNEQHLGLLDTRDLSFQYLIKEKGIYNFSGSFQGNKILFLSTKGSDQNRLWAFDKEKNELNLVDFPIKNNLTSVKGFADGSIFSAEYRAELTPKFAVVDSDLKTLKQMPFGPDEIENIVFSDYAPEHAIYAVSGCDKPAQYFLDQKSSVSLFYDSNRSNILGSHLGKVKSVFVPSFDGLPVPVHYIIPNGTSKNNRKPVIMWVHGGPEDHVDPRYAPLHQFLVNSGFILVIPNVRGSTGFGKAYQFKDNGDWGGGHVKDLVAVADYTKSLAFVDSNNIYILGGSFGGFSVMSLITQYPTVFKAAVDIFGPVELASFMESWPPLAQQYWISEMGVDPRKDSAFNKRVSPIYHLDKIKIPLQVHQGANDIRVLKNQSDNLVKSLQEKGVSVDYHVYENEGHGFLKFENSKKCFTRLVDFFNKQIVRSAIQ